MKRTPPNPHYVLESIRHDNVPGERPQGSLLGVPHVSPTLRDVGLLTIPNRTRRPSIYVALNSRPEL